MGVNTNPTNTARIQKTVGCACITGAALDMTTTFMHYQEEKEHLVPEQAGVEARAQDSRAAREDGREQVPYNPARVEQGHHVEADVVRAKAPRRRDARAPGGNRLECVRYYLQASR
jgi:hypothetical protein